MTHPANDQIVQSRTSEPEAASEVTAPGPDDLERSSVSRGHLGDISRQTEYRKSESDPDFPKVIFMGSRRFYRVRDRIEYVRILEQRSAAKAKAKAEKAAEKARLRALAAATDTD